MKFKVNQKDFFQAIQNIIGVVPVKTTIPILSNVLVILEENELTLTGTDLEISISTKINVQGTEDGAVAVPAKILFEIVRELPDIPLEFATDEEFKITLRTEKGLYRLSGETKEDFPKITIENILGTFTIPADQFNRMINKTIFAVSTDELRTTLMGVYLKVMENELRMVSTDGHRLVKVEYQNLKGLEIQTESIVPTKALNLLLKNIPANGDVKVNLSEDHIIFVLDNTTILSKCIEGQFPNYERVIPTENDKRIILNREMISASVRRVAIFSNSITHQIRLSISNNKINIQSEDIEFGGEAQESIDAEFTGEELEIGYNANYFLDILRHLETEDVILEVKDPISAGIIYPGSQNKNEKILMLLMPIRLNED
ncbi:MAG: DNA polymerase III subunit beta [bacterium]